MRICFPMRASCLMGATSSMHADSPPGGISFTCQENGTATYHQVISPMVTVCRCYHTTRGGREPARVRLLLSKLQNQAVLLSPLTSLEN